MSSMVEENLELEVLDQEEYSHEKSKVYEAWRRIHMLSMDKKIGNYQHDNPWANMRHWDAYTKHAHSSQDRLEV